MNRRYDDTDQQYQNIWYIIDTDFEIVKALDYDVYVDPYYGTGSDFSNGYIRIVDNEMGLLGFIKINSETIENRPDDNPETKPDDATAPNETETNTTTPDENNVDSNDANSDTKNGIINTIITVFIIVCSLSSITIVVYLIVKKKREKK